MITKKVYIYLKFASHTFFVFICQLVKEREGNYSEAVNLYLKAGLPAKAARLAMSQEVIDKYHYQVAWNCCR